MGHASVSGAPHQGATPFSIFRAPRRRPAGQYYGQRCRTRPDLLTRALSLSLSAASHAPVSCDSGFVIATDPKCQFGGEDAMMVNATVKSANWMQCWSPPNAETDGNIPWARTYDVYSRAVEVSLNGVDWTTSNRAFTYYGEAPPPCPMLVSAAGSRARPSLVWQHTRSSSSRCLSLREVRPLEGPRYTLPARTAAGRPLLTAPQQPSDTPCLSGAQITVHGSMFQQSDDLKCKFRRVPHVNCGTGYHVHNATCDMAPETVVDATFLSYWSLKCLSPTGFPESIGGTAHAPADGLPALPVDALNDIKTAPSVTFVEVALDAYHYTDHQREYHYYGEGLRLAHTHPPASTREWRSHSPGALAQMTPSSRSLRLTPLVAQQQAALSSRSSVLALRSSAVLSCTARPYSEREQEAGTPFLKN